jgi:Predicted permease.
MLTEALVWTVLGAVVGLVLAGWGGSVLASLLSTAEEPIALDVSTNWRVVAFTLALALITTALAAVLPGLHDACSIRRPR